MFDRFTVRARQILFHARSQVSQLGSSALEPEHILLGILDVGHGLGCRILNRTGHTLDDFRSDIVGRLPSRERIPESAEVPFSGSCQRVLQYATDEADRLVHDDVGTEHLLLGLLREERSVRWPQIPFVPSRTVHILHSGMLPPQEPVINYAGAVFSAYGFTLEDIIVRAWEGNRWHVDITPGLSDDARFDFLMVLPQQEAKAACVGLLQSAIEQHFAVHVTRETRMRDVYALRHTGPGGRMLRRYPDPEPGTGFASVAFSVFTGRSTDAPMFPLEGFAVHSVPFMFLVKWFEEILGGQVIDETGLRGVYGFELKERVNTPEALIELLRYDAGLVVVRERREIPTLVVRRRGI
jgi:uncharacterized protein (TIGR03435 family)